MSRLAWPTPLEDSPEEFRQGCFLHDWIGDYTGLHRSLDGTIHLFPAGEEPFTRVITVFAMPVNRKFPAIHFTCIGQAADLKRLAQVTPIQVQEAAAKASLIAASRIGEGLPVEVGDDLLNLGLDCFWNRLVVQLILILLWPGKQHLFVKPNGCPDD